jgi:hypothetical protein
VKLRDTGRSVHGERRPTTASQLSTALRRLIKPLDAIGIEASVNIDRRKRMEDSVTSSSSGKTEKGVGDFERHEWHERRLSKHKSEPRESPNLKGGFRKIRQTCHVVITLSFPFYL